jgi:hypothetical protein
LKELKYGQASDAEKEKFAVQYQQLRPPFVAHGKEHVSLRGRYSVFEWKPPTPNVRLPQTLFLKAPLIRPLTSQFFHFQSSLAQAIHQCTKPP